MAVVVKRLTQPAVNRSFEGSIPFDRPNIEFIGLIPKEIMVSSLFLFKAYFCIFLRQSRFEPMNLNHFFVFYKRGKKTFDEVGKRKKNFG